MFIIYGLNKGAVFVVGNKLYTDYAFIVLYGVLFDSKREQFLIYKPQWRDVHICIVSCAYILKLHFT